jgi:small subunit ribosomal protein S6
VPAREIKLEGEYSMTRLYEGMFLIDNDVVRAGWQQAKTSLCELLTKHGAEVQSARRWDERRLAYPIKKKNRATFLLSYFQLPTDAMSALVRELELGDLVMRNLIVSAIEVSDEERQLAAEEDGTDFVVPEPPADDVVDKVERESGEDNPADEIEVPYEASAGADVLNLDDE